MVGLGDGRVGGPAGLGADLFLTGVNRLYCGYPGSTDRHHHQPFERLVAVDGEQPS